VAIKIAALVSHLAQHPPSTASAEMVMAGAIAMVVLGRTHREASKPTPSRTEEARACLEAALGIVSAREPIGYAPFHPSYGWRPDLAAKKEQIATAVLMRSIESAAQLGWSVLPIYAAAPAQSSPMKPLAWLVNSTVGTEVFLNEHNATRTAKAQDGNVRPLYVAPRAESPTFYPDVLRMMGALEKRSYSLNEPHLSGYRLVIGFDTLEDVQAAQQALMDLPPLKPMPDYVASAKGAVSEHNSGEAASSSDVTTIVNMPVTKIVAAISNGDKQ
jgi:hypothetical protein